MSSSIKTTDICVSVNSKGDSFLMPPKKFCRNDSLYMPSFKVSVPVDPYVPNASPKFGDPGPTSVMCACTSLDGNNQKLLKGKCPNTCQNDSSFEFNVFPQHPSGSIFDLPFCYNVPPTVSTVSTASSFSLCEGNCGENTFFTNEVKDITCLDLKSQCGDHGTCGANGKCTCSVVDVGASLKGSPKSSPTGWTGKFCEKPPPMGNPCTPNDAFREKHGGDLDCGNNGSYGICDKSSGQCTCNLLGTQSGTHCEKACISDSQCGGNNRGQCVTLESILGMPCQNTTSDRTYSCLCKNGWSGRNCEIPPDGWQCSSSSDCTTASNLGNFGVTSTGVCSKGKCICNPGYSGVACQKTEITEGGPCNSESPCPDGQFCINVSPGVNVCSKNKNPPPSPGVIDSLILGLIGMFSTPQGLQVLLAFKLIDKLEESLQAAGRYLFKTMASGYLTKGFSEVLTKAAAGEFVDDKVASEVSEVLGDEVMKKILTNMTTSEFLKLGSDRAIEVATEAAIDVSLGPLGIISTLQEALQFLGMILDTIDFAGMNEELLQDQITAYGMKIQASINSGKVAQENNITFPYEISAESTSEFKLLKKTPANENLKLKATSDYIGALVNNSNGNSIIRTFETPTLKSNASKTPYVKWIFVGLFILFIGFCFFFCLEKEKNRIT